MARSVPSTTASLPVAASAVVTVTATATTPATASVASVETVEDAGAATVMTVVVATASVEPTAGALVEVTATETVPSVPSVEVTARKAAGARAAAARAVTAMTPTLVALVVTTVSVASVAVSPAATVRTAAVRLPLLAASGPLLLLTVALLPRRSLVTTKRLRTAVPLHEHQPHGRAFAMTFLQVRQRSTSLNPCKPSSPQLDTSNDNQKRDCKMTASGVNSVCHIYRNAGPSPQALSRCDLIK